MSTLLQKLDAHLPFTKTERIIIAIVLVLHALPALDNDLFWFRKASQSMAEEISDY